MANTSARPATRRPTPRLYLATPVLEDPAALIDALPPLLAAADVAAVLIRLADADPRSLTSRAKALAPLIQNAGAAALIDGHADIVARAGADGAHLRGASDIRDAVQQHKPDRIVGVGGLITRHDAMDAGEAGVDYVLFGEPDAQGRRPAPQAIAERVQWWDELFEPPCVAYAADADEAALFAQSGADFVLVGDMIWNDARGAEAALRDAARAIRRAPRLAGEPA